MCRCRCTCRSISTLQQENLTLSKEQLQLEAEVGPIKYIAALIYGEEESKSMLEEAVRIVILMIVFVFDPLAVLLVMAASRELTPKKKPKLDQFFEKVEPVSEDFNPQEEHIDLHIDDDVSVEDKETLNKTEEESKDESPQVRKRTVGRLLSEIEKQKTNKTKSFLKKLDGKIPDSENIGDADPFK